MDERLKEYREYLVLADQKSIEDFDKTVLLLSGGAMGVSFAFVKDIVGDGLVAFPYGLFFAWASWGISVTSVLVSYFFSHLALRYTIRQVDKTAKESASQAVDIDLPRPGGWYSVVTNGCNVIGGLLFLVGVVLMTIFVYCNLEV